MTDKKPVPQALAEFALEQLAEAGEQAAIDLAVQNVEILRAEIAKRDARIANLERLLNNTSEIAQAVEQELAALKAQQPSAGVVLPEPDFYWVEADEGSWNSPEEWAQDYYDYNGEMPESVSFSCAIELPVREYDSFEFDADGSCISCRLVNHEVARLNPCRAQAVTDGWVDIAERLPEIGRHCLIKIPVCGRHEIEGATYEGDGVWASAWCSSRGRDCTYKVSHWMAAPSAQKESE